MFFLWPHLQYFTAGVALIPWDYSFHRPDVIEKSGSHQILALGGFLVEPHRSRSREVPLGSAGYRVNSDQELQYRNAAYFSLKSMVMRDRDQMSGNPVTAVLRLEWNGGSHACSMLKVTEDDDVRTRLYRGILLEWDSIGLQNQRHNWLFEAQPCKTIKDFWRNVWCH
jgi:hypothetical protein